MRISGLLAVLGLALVLVGCGSTATTAGGPQQGSEPPTASGPPLAIEGEVVGRLRLDGLAGPLLVTRETRPRGGYQLHAYVAGGSGAAATELVDPAGNPIVPFVATDTRPAAYTSVACVAGGLQVDMATPTQPSGVLRAWDIERTRYRVDHAGAHLKTRARVATSVPDRTLRGDWPNLRHQRMFVGCSQSGGPRVE